MLTMHLQQAAEMFVTSVRATPEMNAFVTAKEVFRSDVELQGLRKRLSQRSEELQAIQKARTLTQAEIDDVRFLQNTLNAHPITVQFVEARQAIIARLSECNEALSTEIGFDFASAAAPQSCCG
jgi:cell fate (sporulation/competence/biofilm development) regulator YlbF (YheA/YmcA/DUF963 family)